ncbi:hypothetical protein FQN51_002219 [Onygenales sp. PD_10]|nr:hypothetical protein FQN51_002219 [Onygenales sp. PD_10]
MDPNIRAQVSRPPSANLPPQGPPPLSSNLHQYQLGPHYSMAQPQQHTLPPLQHPQSHSPMQHGYLAQPYRHDMSRYPPTTANDVYAASSAPMLPHTTISSLPPSSFLTHHHSQQYPSHGLPPSSTSQAYPQPIAPAPPRDRREYGALPSGTFSQAENHRPIWGNAPGLPNNSAAFVPKDPPRTQVVGSQGRRGILPSVPGRAAAITNGANGTKSTTIPAKDADGKFPCPHCNKTYLHAKHLKRHLLRHTGDRPYMCVLCKDTFSRSDILKRHFQKCSLRRGNPTGVSHLSHPHAHLKKAQAAGIVPKPVSGDVSSSVPTSNGIVGTTFGEPPVNGVSMAPGHHPRFTEQQPLGYPMQPVGGMTRGPVDHGYAQNQMHQRSSWMAEPKQNSYLAQSGTDTNGQSNVDLPPIDAAKSATVPDSKRPVMATGPTPNQSGELDWTSMFQAGTQDGYNMQPMFPSTVAPVPDTMHTQVDAGERKYYPAATSGHQEGGLNGLYLASTSLGGDGTLGSYPIWNFNKSQNNPLQNKTDRLINFCFPSGLQEPFNPLDNSAQLKDCLTADNVKHFLDLFTNYQGHWPYLHIATFNFLDAYDGLILAMCCIGAVYSDRVDPSLVRSLVARTKAAILRTSRIQQILQDDLASDADAVKTEFPDPQSLTATDIEEMQSIFMMSSLSVWHGDPKQRAAARSDVVLFARFIRRFRLLELARPENPFCYSVLHNLAPNQPVDISIWNWRAWVEQEKRSRLVFMFYLADAARVMFFNSEPIFNPQEIKIPLPCDDAAWEARDAQQCADALGLRGPDIQATLNVTGSRRMKQLEMNQALSALQSPAVMFHPRATNAYSKFILIHALHVHIWLFQRQLSIAKSTENGNATAEGPGAINPDVAIVKRKSTSDQVTPIDRQPLDIASCSSPHPDVILDSTVQALEKWKHLWDEDMALQYPPATCSRRFGFCRDAVPYYWLAQALLRSNRLDAWKLAPDARLMHIMRMLKDVRVYAQTDAAKRGEGLGSISDIHDSYAVEDLTLDMKLIFRPIHQQYEGGLQTSPRDTPATIHTSTTSEPATSGLSYGL